MITIGVWKSFNWTTLTLRWYAERPDTALSPQAAIQQAATDLEDRGASVTIAPTGDALSFRRRRFTGRTWFAYVWNGKVDVSVASGRTTAVASGSVAPVVLLPGALLLVMYLQLRWLAFVVGMFLVVLIPVIYLICSNGIQITATAALKPHTGDGAA